MKQKESPRKAKLDEELMKGRMKGIGAARPGSLEQTELVAQLERVRVCEGSDGSCCGRW